MPPVEEYLNEKNYTIFKAWVKKASELTNEKLLIVLIDKF